MTPTAARVAQRALLAMAYDRRAFVNKVQEHLGGALLEFYKAQSATKNGQTRWVKHWRSEVEQLLEHGLVTALLHPIRGFTDRRKAFDLAAREIQVSDASYRTTAQNQVKRDFRLKRLRVELDDQDTKAFWRKVEDVVATTPL